MKVLAIGPHPDDVELAMAGTILSLRSARHEVVVCDLTDGEPTPIGTQELRMSEAARAAELLGVRRITLNMPNRSLADTMDNRRQVAEVIRKVRPELLFVPYWEDAHPDHVAGAALCEAARFWAKLTHTTIPGEPWFPPRVVHFLSVHYKLHPRLSFIVDVTRHIEQKMRALAAYESQFGLKRGNSAVLDRLRTASSYYGGLIGTGYGEPFICREEIGLSGLDQLV
ncbi:bacillithiol biosynthesis deacetylase BshB1 [Streptomyces lavendulae]|uniref:bacillithiol biosynthesis deacetylase BshB1 n=1 Tax=Streptomyces lavendulae TaxID=1914 RepID=UPI003405FEEA